MTEPDDQQWSRRRLRDEASDRAAQNDSASDGTDSDAETDGPRATPLSPRGAAEPLSYITQERGSAAGGAFRPRRDDDQLPPAEAIEQVDAPAYRVRDFSPEGRAGVPSWAPAYTQTRNPFASTADQAAQGDADEHGELDYQTARRDEVPAPAASTEGSEPPPITESIPIYNGERTMTRRELRALREAKAAEAAAAGRPAPEIFVTSITGVPQERPGAADEADYIETAEAAPAEETVAESAADVAEATPIDRPVTERPEWAPVFSDAPSGADAVVDEAAVESDADETTAADQAAAPAETAAEAEPDAAAETEAAEPAEVETAETAEPEAAAEPADVIEPEAEAEPVEPESAEPTAAEPAPASPFSAAPPRPVDLIEPPEPARWSPESNDASVFDQLLSTGGGEDAPQSPYATSAPSIDELLFGAPTPPPARESEAEQPAAEQPDAEATDSVDAPSAPVDDAAAAAEPTEVAEADAEPETVETETETVSESEPEPAADPAIEPVGAEADAVAPAEPVADEPADESAAEPVADEPVADEPVADEADIAAPAEPVLPSLSDLPPPNADPAEPNGNPNSYLGAAPSLADRVDMPAPPSWRAPEPPEQDAPAAEAEAETDEHDAEPVLADADAEEIVVDEAPADEPVEAHPVVVDVTPLPAEPLPDAPATSADPAALHWSNQHEDEHGDFVASRDVIGGHGVVTTNALVLPSIPQPEFGTPLATTGEIIITGSIDLPRSLSSTGAHPTQLDESALDHELDPGDHQVASTDSQPVRAIRAVSTHTSTRGMMSNPKPRGNRTLTVLIIASGGLAVLVVGVLIFGIVTNQF
ncbi:hypothetical protein [Schumannella sp. 10F1B-5-1]|uniref:hypothetical protein n=1 Tax=Schumannella sp. 10F1B-5-1 TaxID=2590780 RepID=UPI001130FBF0|nr:hypothetical protein [Schumannella sp. 10F1B-5-1]TPW70170.1 hypothetical protein FJ658_14200 [Schumannella sp. 10F1B-5-1]